MENTFNCTREQYQAAITAWSSVAAHSAADHIIYNIIRSKPIKHGFCEKKTNIQGNDPWYEFTRAYYGARYMVMNQKELFKFKFGFEAPTGFLELIKT